MLKSLAIGAAAAGLIGAGPAAAQVWSAFPPGPVAVGPQWGFYAPPPPWATPQPWGPGPWMSSGSWGAPPPYWTGGAFARNFTYSRSFAFGGRWIGPTTCINCGPRWRGAPVWRGTPGPVWRGAPGPVWRGTPGRGSWGGGRWGGGFRGQGGWRR